MQPRVQESENYSVTWTSEEALRARVVKNKKKSEETVAQVDIRALKARNYKSACDRHCLLFSRGLCVHICAALECVPTPHGGPLKWEDFLPYLDTMEAWDA